MKKEETDGKENRNKERTSSESKVEDFNQNLISGKDKIEDKRRNEIFLKISVGLSH